MFVSKTKCDTAHKNGRRDDLRQRKNVWVMREGKKCEDLFLAVQHYEMTKGKSVAFPYVSKSWTKKDIASEEAFLAVCLKVSVQR